MKTRRFPSSNRTSAFTLVELLVSIAIVLILAALILGASHKAMQTTKYVKSASNLKELSAIGLSYAADNDSEVPGKRIIGLRPWTCLEWDLDILQHLDPSANPDDPAGSPGRIAAEISGKIFSSPLDIKPLNLPATDIRRSYVMNSFLFNLWGAHPAYPGAPVDTPARLCNVPVHAKVWFIADGFRPWGSGLGTGKDWGAHIGGTPWSGLTIGDPDWVTVAFLDGHVERINIGKMTYGGFWVRHSDPQTAVNY